MNLLPKASNRLKDFVRAHNFYVALYSTSKARDSYSPFGEVVAQGYEPGGKKIILQDDLSCDCVVWPNSTITAMSALVYDKNTGLGFVFCAWDEPVKSTRDEFTVHFGGFRNLGD